MQTYGAWCTNHQAIDSSGSKRTTSFGKRGVNISPARVAFSRKPEDFAGPNMERLVGIEPTTPAWKAEVLPLNYSRVARGGSCVGPLGVQAFVLLDARAL